MKRIEAIYREILYNAIENKKFSLTQSEISKKLGISLSLVNLAVKKLNSLGAVDVLQRNFKVRDIKKIIYYWASIRNLEKDIILMERIEMSVRDIERNMPNLFYTAYTSYKLKFDDVPADYSEVYVYANDEELIRIKKRFKIKDSIKNIKPNLFVLRKDKLIDLYKKIPVAQVFVDLWNLKEWYAKEFINSFEKRMNL